MRPVRRAMWQVGGHLVTGGWGPRRCRFAFVLLTVWTLSACATGGDTPRWGADLKSGPSGNVTVRVENRSLTEVSLFAYSAGDRIRLGTVSGISSSTVRIPWSGTGPLAILIDAVGGSPFETNSLDVREGEILQLTIGNPLTRSEFYK